MSDQQGQVLPGPGGPATAPQTMAPQTPVAMAARWSPWRAVVGFGVVSLAADMVYEGARSVTGPLLASLGASALAGGPGHRCRRGPGPGAAAGVRLRWPTAPAATGRSPWVATR